jgi:hypothetical protein
MIFDQTPNITSPISFALNEAMNAARIMIEAAGGEIREGSPSSM